MSTTPEEMNARMEELRKELGIMQPTPSSIDLPVATPPSMPSQPNLGVMDLIAPYLPTGLEAGGSLAGMARGAQAGRVLGLPGAVGGAIVGAFAGAGAGESLKNAIQGGGDVVEVLNTALTAGAFAAGGEAIVGSIANGLQAINKIRTGAELSPQDAKALSELQTELQKQGITLTPAQITQSGFQRSLEGVAISGFGGENIMRNLYEAQADFVLNRIEAIIPNLGTASRQEVGQAFQSALRDAEAQLITWAKPKYAELDKLAVQAPVSLKSTQQTLRNSVAKGKYNRKAGEGSRLDPEVESMYQFVLGEKQTNDFRSTFQLISRLSSDLRKVQGRTTSPNDVYEKALRDTIEALHNDLAKAAERTGNTDILTKYKEVSQVYRESMKTLRDDAIRGLATKAPEYVGETIYQSGNVTAIQKAFEAIDKSTELARLAGETPVSPDVLKNKIRAGYLDALITPLQTSASTIPSAEKLLLSLTKDAKKADTFNTLFTTQQQAEIKKVLGWANQMEKGASGNFSLLVRGRQSGAVNKIAGKLAQAGAFAAGPAYFTIEPISGAIAIATIASPALLAKRATSGKLSNDMLKKAATLVQKFDQGQFTSKDWGAWFGILADTAYDGEKVEEPLTIEGLTAEETYRKYQLESQLKIQ
jgi:hypothetical protein